MTVSQIAFTPGSPVLYVTLNGEKRSRQLLTDQGTITIDGRKATPARLLGWLLTTRAKVTLHPERERYGASVNAEFETEVP